MAKKRRQVDRPRRSARRSELPPTFSPIQVTRGRRTDLSVLSDTESVLADGDGVARNAIVATAAQLKCVRSFRQNAVAGLDNPLKCNGQEMAFGICGDVIQIGGPVDSGLAPV